MKDATPAPGGTNLGATGGSGGAGGAGVQAAQPGDNGSRDEGGAGGGAGGGGGGQIRLRAIDPSTAPGTTSGAIDKGC